MSYSEDESDPKSPHEVKSRKKTEGSYERSESRKDGEREDRRHVHVRC